MCPVSQQLSQTRIPTVSPYYGYLQEVLGTRYRIYTQDLHSSSPPSVQATVTNFFFLIPCSYSKILELNILITLATNSHLVQPGSHQSSQKRKQSVLGTKYSNTLYKQQSSGSPGLPATVTKQDVQVFFLLLIVRKRLMDQISYLHE